ncbi:DUF4893 domain-containing protein [Sphingomonas sp. ID0503]|uniref:DUF4893 domain-containing protein n=1 Tax=Sphingomonas sp. ID0503 TaxID=3399691 RepID=UPI003AFACC3C
MGAARFATIVGIGIGTCTLLSGCGGGERPALSQTEAPSATDWRSVVTDPDRERLREWRTAWIEALADARAAGKGAEVAAAGVLLEPDAATGDPMPPTGDYRCQVTKVGAKSAGMLPFISYPPFLCRIAEVGGAARFEKVTGSQRPQGILYRDNGTRLVFLGSMVLGDERRARPYGGDEQRDLAGFLERIAPARWRLVLPRPAWESKLDVLDIRPVT